MNERSPGKLGEHGGAQFSDGLRPIRTMAIVILIVLALVTMVWPLVGSLSSPQPTPVMLYKQDLVLLPLVAIAILLFRGGKPLPPVYRLPQWWGRWWWVPAVIGLFALCYLGHYAVLWGIDLSRDEQMAVFDAKIYRSGHLAAPILPEWRGFAPALNLLFMLPIGDHAAWVSSYLPVNAGLRALVGLVTDPVVTSPVLVVIGFLALVAITRRLWPDSPGSRLAALLCYLGSSQIVLTGMTAYAMSAHLAFNLVWMLLFLRGDRIGFVGTLIVGFLATGAHQPLFHPLFAFPFVLQLVLQDHRQWRRFIAYGVAYALIVGFWLAWPVWLSGRLGAVPDRNAYEGIDYATRLMNVLTRNEVSRLWTMGANLIRFVTWQHLLLLPLMLLGTVGGWRRWPLVRPLAVGLVLPILILGVILPWQGHGWGYRYLHPVMGSACLLAGYGWQRAEAMNIDLRRLMQWTTAASLLVLLPLHCWMARTLMAPQAGLDRAIAALPADIVVIDFAAFSDDLVLNAPDLSNRPIRLDGQELRPADIAALCRGRRIAFVDAPQLDSKSLYYFGKRVERATPGQLALHAAALSAGCSIVSR